MCRGCWTVPVIPAPRPVARPPVAGARSQVAALAGFLALSALAWVLASAPIILNANGWYAGSVKAPWMPPTWMFRTTWMGLYVGVAAAAWLVWRRGGLAGGTRTGYVLQLLLNTAWPVAFFGLYPMLGAPALWAAFLIICALAGTLAFLTLRFGPVDAAAGVLVLPYFSWLVFSASLNLYAAMHN